MGTTLENGVYLPSEGERNCYAGLKTNWEILDQKVADVTALQQAVAGALHREIVESLPTTDIDPNTIYMVLSGTSATENVYNEFMYVNNAWELIGTSATDLTNYYTKGDVDGLLILKANASDLTSHTGDATIHVTTADKSKWNNGVSQAYVFRYSSTALVASSTNSNTLLDNTDNLKVGDKVIDSSGVLFSITAIDTANSTFTIGTALIDLALDANVVHTSGNENVGGIKNFTDDTYIKSLNFTNEVPSPSSSNTSILPIITTITYSDGSPSVQARLNLRVTADGVKSLYPHENNQYALGLTSRKWSEVHGVTYYYGSSDVEFSNKFVTTDTNQTISGDKTFSSIIPIDGVYLGNESSTNERTNLCLRSNRDTANKSCAYISRFRTNKNQGELSDSDISFISISFLENETRYTRCFDFGLTDWDTDGVPQTYYLTSPGSKGSLGTSSRKWQLINGLEPSSLSLPSGNTSDRLDISSYITAFDGTTNSYTPLANGWISISVNNCTEVYVFLNNLYGVDNNRPTAGSVRVTLPVLKGITVGIRITGGSLVFARFLPCLGNI